MRLFCLNEGNMQQEKKSFKTNENVVIAANYIMLLSLLNDIYKQVAYEFVYR